jgi:phage-related tail fiber protein
MTFYYKLRQTPNLDSLNVASAPTESYQAVNKNYADSAIATAVAAKSLTLAGDATGTGTSTINVTLANTGVTPGTYAAVTVDSKGRVTSAQSLTLSGEVTGVSVNGSLVTTLSNTGVVAGSYTKVTVDSKGRVTSAGSLTGTDVSNALGYTPIGPAGGTLTGSLLLKGNPTQDLEAATKAYVDTKALFALAVGIY